MADGSKLVSAKRRQPKPTAGAMPGVSTTDKRLAAAALEAQRIGKRPTREEAAALRRFERARDEALRDQHYAAIPKKLWREWSGRQDKVLDDQAVRYGLPLGRTINLAEVVRWLHDFLAANARKLAGTDEDDPAIAGAASPALERKRAADAALRELQLEREMGRTIWRAELHECFARIADLLAKAGDALRREFGPGAQKIINDALEDARRTLDTTLGDDSGDSTGGDRSKARI